ncbi:MAG TPA: hypothetical protein VM577_15275, partial [Anaerovoracaceae bacterium]|nr:hypothetical protein [Anaerovoracaceae bacterium]
EFFDELKSFFFEKADIQAIEQLMSQGGDEVALQELFNKAQYNAGIHPEFRDLRSKLNIVNVKRKQEEEAKKKREVSEQDKLNQAKRHAEKASRKSATLDRINRLPSRVDHLPNNIHNKPVTNKYKEEYFGSDEAELDDE